MPSPVLNALRNGRFVRVATARAADATRKIVWEPLNRRFGVPLMGFETINQPVATDPVEFVQTLFPLVDLHGVTEEFITLEESFAARMTEVGLVYGSSFAVERGTAFVLYAITRLQRPTNVLETGVADGVSSYFILAALRKNDHETLHSTDIRDDTGILVDSTERWDRFLLDRRIPGYSLKSYVSQLPSVDFFIHDSLHRRKWHNRELTIAYSKMQTGGILASDDVDSSFAFLEFCKREGLSGNYFFDRRKFFGAARRP